MSNLHVSGAWGMRSRFLYVAAFALLGAFLLSACGGAAMATPTPIPADIVRPEQPTPPLSTAEPRFQLEPSTREPVFVYTPTPLPDVAAGASSAKDFRSQLLRSYLMDQPPTALGIAPGGVTIVDKPGGRAVATVPGAGSVTVSGRSADGKWLAVFTDGAAAGWVPEGSLVLFGADDLKVVDKTFSPAPVATLIAGALTPVSTPLDVVLAERAKTPASTPEGGAAQQVLGATPGDAQQDSAQGATVGRIAGGNNANLRKGPSTTTAVLTSLAPGSSIVIVGQSDDGGWYQVRTPAGDGWIAASLVENE